jgi:hypothetical protein
MNRNLVAVVGVLLTITLGVVIPALIPSSSSGSGPSTHLVLASGDPPIYFVPTIYSKGIAVGSNSLATDAVLTIPTRAGDTLLIVGSAAVDHSFVPSGSELPTLSDSAYDNFALQEEDGGLPTANLAIIQQVWNATASTTGDVTFYYTSPSSTPYEDLSVSVYDLSGGVIGANYGTIVPSGTTSLALSVSVPAPKSLVIMNYNIFYFCWGGEYASAPSNWVTGPNAGIEAAYAGSFYNISEVTDLSFSATFTDTVGTVCGSFDTDWIGSMASFNATPYPPPAPTILGVTTQGLSYAAVSIQTPYVYCGSDCNNYDLTNLTLYYQIGGGAQTYALSWLTSYHAPGYTDLNWQADTTMYIETLIPSSTYYVVAAAWNSTGTSPLSNVVSFSTPSSTPTGIPPTLPHVRLQGTLPTQNITNPPNGLTNLIVLSLPIYQFSGSLYTSSVSWTNRGAGTFTGEFVLQAWWLQYVSHLNVTVNGKALTNLNEYGAGNGQVYVFPNATSVAVNGTAQFTLTFIYTPPSPLSNGVNLNGIFYSLGELFDIVAIAVVVILGYLSLFMKRIGVAAVMGTILIFITVGVELFG